MLRTALTGLRAHTLRFSLTVLSIVLGVAFVAGSFVFTDTIRARFDTLFTDVYAGVDATVRPSGGDAAIDAALLDDVRALDEVEQAVGVVGGSVQLVAEDGTPIGGQGPPTIGISWSDVPSLNALRIDDGDGRAPGAADEIVIDVATSTGHDLVVGDDVTVATPTGTGAYTVVGLASFGSEDNLAGATITAFTLEEAQRVLDLDGRLTQIDVAGHPGIDQEALVGRLDAAVAVGDGRVEVVTGDQQTREELEAVTSGLGFLGSALLAFAGVAVFVGAFVIQNTFRITVAQRVRELALLRALGATAGQVTRLVLAEALALAVVGSGIGVVVGLGVAGVIKGGMEAIGIGIPDGPLTVEPRTVVVSVLVGVVVTLVAAVLPARRAARIAPVEAMGDAARPTGRRSLRLRAVAGGVVAALGVAAAASGVVLAADVSLPLLAVGGLLLVVGLSILAPLLVVPVARLLALPMRDITGRLARENTVRQPRRTAATASALMVGVALVAFVSILAASVRDSAAATIEEAFPAELAAMSTNLNQGVSPRAVAALRATDDIGTVSPVLGGHVVVDGEERSATGIDPATFDTVFDARATIELAGIGDGVVVRDDLLDHLGWTIGHTIGLTTADGTVVPSEVVGTYDQQGFAGLVVAADLLAEVADDERVDVVLVDVPTGTSVEEAREVALAAVADFPAVRVDTQADTVAQAEAQVDQLVALFSGLLVLALLIAVLGIANTLALSVVERTREIGLLRAVGMVPGQVRRMVRREAVVTAVFGAVLGIGLGTVLGVGAVTAMADQGLGTFSVPAVSLLLWLAAAGLAGVVASVGPARRAARLDVLVALGGE